MFIYTNTFTQILGEHVHGHLHEYLYKHLYEHLYEHLHANFATIRAAGSARGTSCVLVCS